MMEVIVSPTMFILPTICNKHLCTQICENVEWNNRRCTKKPSVKGQLYCYHGSIMQIKKKMHFLLNLHYRPMDLSHRVSGTWEPAPAWFVSSTMIWPSMGGKHFINRTGANQLLLCRWPCLLLPEFMVMWRWENSLQNECSGTTLQMLQVNCYN
jgi:hypothetical protein